MKSLYNLKLNKKIFVFNPKDITDMKGTLCLLTFFAIFCLFIVNVSAQDTERSAFADIMPEPGKKKEVKFPNRPVVLPEGVSALQYCITCRAVTKELMNRLGYEVRPTAVKKLS